MNPEQIQTALADITAETDPRSNTSSSPALSPPSSASAIELVVVGGSAIEFHTEGAYVSGHLDLCVTSSSGALTVRQRQELMGRLSAQGGPRNWQVAGQYVDILGEVETLARTPFDELQAPFGPVRLVSPEDLLVERVLISVYPQRHEPAELCARKLIAVGLSGQVEVDWAEARRLATLPEYDILPVLETLVGEIAHELGKASPYHS